MPTYIYICKKCNAERELFKSVKPDKVWCKCGAEMDRKYTGVAVHFKGNGWTPKNS